MEVLPELVAGSVGGLTSKLFDYPLDTVKVLLQTQTPGTYDGAWHCLSSTVRKKGIPALYRGISSPLVGCVAENAVLFFAYGGFRKLLSRRKDDEENLTDIALAGAAAGGVVSFVLTPVELVKTRLQVQNGGAGFRVFRGPWDVISRTVREEGIVRGLFRGHFSTMCREIPGNACYFGVYEMSCRAMIPPGGTREDLGPTSYIIGGILSGTAYWVAFYPADTVKSLMQSHPAYANKTFAQTFLSLYRTSGVRGLYRGLGVTLLKAAPSTALLFTSYEFTLKAIGG